MLYQLSYARIKILVDNTKSFGPYPGKLSYPVLATPLYWSSKHGAPLLHLWHIVLQALVQSTSSHAVYNCLFPTTFRVADTCPCGMLVCPVLSTNKFIYKVPPGRSMGIEPILTESQSVVLTLTLTTP